MSAYRTPKSFAKELGYARSTVAKWLPEMREDGVAMGHGKLTRIDVERAKQWITAHTQPKPVLPMMYVVHAETLQ